MTGPGSSEEGPLPDDVERAGDASLGNAAGPVERRHWRGVAFDRRTALRVVSIVALVTLGFVMIGVEAIPLVVVALLASLAWRREPGRPLAFAACVLLVVAALGTAVIVPTSADGWGMTFSADRNLATDAARLAGLLVLVASVLMASVERSRTAAPRRVAASDDRLGIVSAVARARQPSSAPTLWAGCGAGLALAIGGAVRLGLAPRALPVALEPLLMNLRLGRRFTLDLLTNAGAAAPTPPLSPLIIAYVPLPATVVLLFAGLATVVVCGRLGRHLGGRWTGVVVMAIAALLPSMWNAPLPIVLAGLCLIGAVMLVDGARTTSSRAVWGGVIFGLAVTARPETLLVLPLVLLWSWDRGSTPGQLGLIGGAALATVSPWWVWIHQQAGGLVPATTVATFLNDAASAARNGQILGSVAGVVALAVAIGLSGRRIRREWWILWVVPIVSVLLSTSDLPARDALGWSAPLAAVLCGVAVAQRMGVYVPPLPRRPRPAVGPISLDTTGSVLI